MPTINPSDLTGFDILVTGAGRGLGKAAAKMLAGCGAKVIGVSRTEIELRNLKNEIEQDGGWAEIATLDVTNLDAVRSFINKLPKLDAVINNAGWNHPQHVLDVDDTTFDAMIDINLRATFAVAQAAAKRFKREGIKGSIVNMSSQMGHVGGPLRSVYCMTKFGLEGMTKAMAVDLASDGIRVNTVAPTFVETPLASKFLEEKSFKEFVIGSIPMGKLATEEQVAAACVYLCSPLAAMTTGTSILIDGGWTAK
jgi:NAD(P)-dependent dehydrogenase (short-subunit alcohol dehydrogenase family)